MHLINANSLQLESFADDKIPKYAILSHRWQDEEISFQDIRSGQFSHKAGYVKLQNTCKRAVGDGHTYVWVDACCIDKTSSAELSEAINSMFRWYQQAVVCYAYLFDVPKQHSFEDSAWFSRGWTLQELIAPRHVEFFDSNWTPLGTKQSLTNEITRASGIDAEVLAGLDPSERSIAQRMSWASDRVTTRIEDIAYSLLGLFDVNMAMLYGEGQKAFIRLQEEIMKQSDDHSIFAWTLPDDQPHGLLARSPKDFKYCSTVTRNSTGRLNRAPYSVGNMGLSISLPVVAWAMEIFLAPLDCEDGKKNRTGVFLMMLPERDQYARTSFEGRGTIVVEPALLKNVEYRSCYIRQKPTGPFPPADRPYGFSFRRIEPWPKSRPFDLRKDLEVLSWHPWSPDQKTVNIPHGSRGTAGILLISRDFMGYWPICFKFGFNRNFEPVFLEDENAGLAYRRKKDFDMAKETAWVDKTPPKLFIADRLSGIEEDLRGIMISIKREVTEQKATWIVDVLCTDP